MTHRGLLSVELPLLQAAGGLDVGHQNQVRGRRRPAVHSGSIRRERYVVHDFIIGALNTLFHDERLGRAQLTQRHRVSRRAIELRDP